MRKLYSFTLGFFLLTVRAEKEDFQGYHTEQTKGTTVTKDLLLKKENTVRHGTAAIPTENTLQHTAAAVTAKFPRAVLFDTRPTGSYETAQITKASTIIASPSREHFVSRNRPSSLTSTRNNPSATRIHTESEIPLISNYEKIVFTSTQAALESMMNGTSKPDVHLSAAVKASLWLNTPLDIRNQRNTDSITLTSADRRPGVPILSASHPRVIDNLAALHNDNDDKRSQGTDKKGISDLGRNQYVFGVQQYISQSDTAEDLVRGNTVTNLCLTCLKDQRPASSEKSVALLDLSPYVSSDSLSTEGLALDFSQFTTSSPSLQQPSVVKQGEILNKDQNGSKHSSFDVKEQLVYKLTFPPLSINKTVNHRQNIMNNSQIESFPSNTGTVASDTQSLAQMSSATEKDTKKQAKNTYPSETLVTERPILTTAALYRLSKTFHSERTPVENVEQEMFGKNVSIGDPQSVLKYLSKNNKSASHSLSTNFKNAIIQNQPLDVGSGSVSSTPVITEAPHNNQNVFLPEDTDLSAASPPTERMRLNDAHRAITSFGRTRPTTSAVRHPESHSLTRRDDFVISVSRSQTPAKPSSQTKEPMLTSLLKYSANKFESVTTKTHRAESQDSHTFNTVNSTGKQPFVVPSGPVMKEPQNPTFTTRTRFVSQIVEMKNKPFSKKVTSNHRPLHSTLRSQSSKLSKVTSFPTEPYTQMKPHPSIHKAMSTKHGDTSLTKENTHNKVVEATFSQTVTPKMTPKLSQTFGVGTSKLRDASKATISSHSRESISTHPGLNTISNILSLTKPQLAVTAGFLQAQPHFTVNSSTLHASIIYSISDHRHKFSPSVSKENSLSQTINEIELGEHIIPAHTVESSVKNPAVPQQMYNDSSTRPPTTGALSFEAHISIGQLQAHQGQSAHQISQSSTSSFDMTSGQPCSFKLSEQTAHSDALHAPVDDNEQRSVQTLMASMSPKAKDNQFPLSSMSPLLNIVPFGGDSLPDTYSLTGITISGPEKEILRAKSDAEYVNSGRGRAESLLGTTNETDQSEENDSLQKMVTLTSTEKTTLENNRLSKLESYNETTTQPIMFAIQTTHIIEQAKNEDFVPVTNDFVESHSLPEIPQIQANDVTNNAISATEHHAGKRTEKQRDLSTPRGTEGDSTIPVAHNNFRSDLEVPNISTQQIVDRIMNVTSDFQISTNKTNDFVSLAPTAHTNGFIVSTKAHESALTTSDSVKVVVEKLVQAAHAERMVQSNIEPLSLRETPTTPTPSKLPPAVQRNNTTETQTVKEPEDQISVQAIEQSQHAMPGVIPTILTAAHRAGEAHDATPTMIVDYSSFKDIKTALTTISIYEAKHPLRERTTTDRADQHKKHALSVKTSINQVILGAVTGSVPPTAILPIEINKTTCRTIGCAMSGEITKTTGADEIDHTAPKKMYPTQAGLAGKEHLNTVHTLDTKTESGNCSTDCPVPGKATPQGTNLNYAVISPATSKSDHAYATVETKTWRVPIETEHLERGGTLKLVEKTTQRQSRSETTEAQEAVAAEVTLPELEATTGQTTVKTTECTLLTDEKTKTQLNRGAAKAEIFEAQNATRSARAVSKEETEVQESGHRLLLPEPESESELPRLRHRRRLPPHLYLSGVTEVSDDLCGSGNYTAEMSLNLGRGVEPGDAVPAMGNLRVVINLKTNNSWINLEVTSCCLSPTIQPNLTNSTCCFFSRLAAEPAGITLLPSALSTSASFTISLFQMINYSVVYLHCDLSICPRNRSDCERQCLQQRSAFPSEGPEAVVTNLRNRISFGPMLKDMKNSTFPEEIDPSQLDLVLVIISLAVGSSLLTVMLLLVWLAYRRRAIWPPHLAAPPRACCGCLRPGSDLILP